MDTQQPRRWLPAPVATTIVVAVLVAACGGSTATGPAGSSAPTASPAPTPSATATPAPSPSPSPAATATPEAVVPGTLPHEAPDLEALLPTSVGGRPLSIWSVRGATMAEMFEMSPEILAQLEGELAAEGKTLDDFVEAIAGRSDVDNDPPYFVLAFEIPEGVDTGELIALAAMGFTVMPTERDFTKRTIGGKEVLVGTLDMLGQTVHQQGLPYVYERTKTQTFFVITDDPAWAEEALAALP